MAYGIVQFIGFAHGGIFRNMGFLMSLKAFTAAVFGGIGNIHGGMLGCMAECASLIGSMTCAVSLCPAPHGAGHRLRTDGPSRRRNGRWGGSNAVDVLAEPFDHGSLRVGFDTALTRSRAASTFRYPSVREPLIVGSAVGAFLVVVMFGI
ncbi:hypothetical protein [Streptomyces sp. NPDC001903]|uniref:hypothetical protein n=1 Tax=Streptomyces sp. NPDC001903 TaxID=3364622 RepID=UPI003687C289